MAEIARASAELNKKLEAAEERTQGLVQMFRGTVKAQSVQRRR